MTVLIIYIVVESPLKCLSCHSDLYQKERHVITTRLTTLPVSRKISSFAYNVKFMWRELKRLLQNGEGGGSNDKMEIKSTTRFNIFYTNHSQKISSLIFTLNYQRFFRDQLKMFHII